MNKMLCLICIVIVFSLSVSAQTITCAKGAGTVIKGNDGTEYCLSKMAMNWWTALGWCQAIGKSLIQYPSDCRCDGDNCPTEMVKCPNLKGIAQSNINWTSTPYDEKSIYTINFNHGGPDTFSRTSQQGRALCK